MTKEPGIKFDLGKPKYSLLPWESVEQAVWVLMFGEQKYEADNWKNIEDGHDRYVESLERHVVEVMRRLKDGEDPADITDAESNMPVLAHVACCALFAMWFIRDKLPRKYDISWVREHFAKLREEYRSKVKTDADGNATRDSATEDIRLPDANSMEELYTEMKRMTRRCPDERLDTPIEGDK